jgi:hypothetical protein
MGKSTRKIENNHNEKEALKKTLPSAAYSISVEMKLI